jgi:hypothetical protein
MVGAMVSPARLTPGSGDDILGPHRPLALREQDRHNLIMPSQTDGETRPKPRPQQVAA